MLKKENFTVGRQIETLVANYIKKNHFRVIERNYRTLVGEIDIIATKKGVYHIIEVKYRHNLAYGYPREHVTPDKQRKIKRSAEYFFMVNKIIEPRVSFDIAEVIGTDKKTIELIENAF